ncbi:hypothetical protein DEU56DRAFT_871163 [Suillus clintonianus]|uniref:uncharacterized protein n=1 Tax=Suillus clintonianus TaxID=1904413 RepID=UPI001B865E03|nr:uncharacterized protein DEU56DRAFT_871163 [Suillus clintonianus]KAG2139346.1 hypothetical protein DEU56DRAFT_871163 [Suillus clintonianus]
MAKPFIHQCMTDICHPPTHPPEVVILLLAGTLGQDRPTILACWVVLRQVIWTHGTVLPTDKEIEAFNRHGLMRGIGYHDLYPPTRVCQSPECTNYRDGDEVATLTDVNKFRASLFTLRDGSLPVHSVSTYCRQCHTRYYHNYRIHNADSTRMYYAGVPSVIQAARHFYIEAALLELFAATKVFGWMSSMNCARVYNYALAQRHAYMSNNRRAFDATLAQAFDKEFSWQYTLRMRDTDVLNGFFIHSLLLEKAEHNSCLVLPHDEQQRTRIDVALSERNKEMEGIGQEAYPHACDLCFIVIGDDSKTKIQAAVCDGNTIGHPCCTVHDCKVPLMTNRHRFCPDHQDLNQRCTVNGCDKLHTSGSRTCGNVDHQALEDAYFKPAKALFQLRVRLKRAGITLPLDSLIMRPCGVILARATFFGSEAVSAEFAKMVFPTAASTPEFFVFDNNCKLRAHQDAIGDDHFAATGMPVDVFHFNSKHKETDTYCQQHCNPAAFPELVSGGKWQFNTSICEQTNVWLGGYQAILRDMSVHRYNFYLDEMIKRRNRYVISESERRGHSPWMISMDALFGSD